jgi:hypothetical protein
MRKKYGRYVVRQIGDQFWSLIVVTVMVSAWAIIAHLLKLAQRTRPPFTTYGSWLHWLLSCSPLDTMLLAQLGCLLLRMPFKWPLLLKPLQVSIIMPVYIHHLLVDLYLFENMFFYRHKVKQNVHAHLHVHI